MTRTDADSLTRHLAAIEQARATIRARAEETLTAMLGRALDRATHNLSQAGTK